MSKKKALLTVALLSLSVLLLASQAQAVDFWDMELGGFPLTNGGVPAVYTHQLGDLDFLPPLAGGEVLDIQAASWNLFLTAYSGVFTLSADLDGIPIGSVDSISFTPGSFSWLIDLGETAYNVLEDRVGVISVNMTSGSGFTLATNSTLSGSGVVVPEPLSLLLLGGGLLGLGVVRKKTIV